LLEAAMTSASRNSKRGHNGLRKPKQLSFPFGKQGKVSRTPIGRENIAIIISLFAMAFTGWQVWEAHLSLSLGNRPYVGLENISVKYHFDSSDQAGVWETGRVTADFKVYGNTPAVNLVLRQGCALVDREWYFDTEPGLPKVDRVSDLPSVIMPSSSRTVLCTAEIPGHQLKGNYAAAIFAGQVKYEDIFKNKHTTEFCYWGAFFRDDKESTTLKPCAAAKSRID
jgi:hypothetical protein